MTPIQTLVAELPELYQPIFRHPELSEGSSRTSHDRLAHIADIYKVLEKVQGRPLKVLDLGCAQGFFSLNLAALGATVHGVDYLEQNVQVCRALAAEHQGFQAQFTFGKVQEFLETVQAGDYDLVLGLSVFHHLVYDLGKERIKEIIEQLLHKVTAFIGEFAVCEEPLYWGPAQPQDPRYLVSNSAFLHELARHSTHLADIQRPLYFASNQVWYLDGMGERIKSWTPDSHALAAGAHQGARRYYISDGFFVKVFRVDGVFGERNQTELQREAQFLQNPPAGFSAPRHYTSGANALESWLVTDRIDGELLLDAISRGESLDPRGILLEVLAQLALLERQGFYHDDLRVWNIMLDAGRKARLIDFGSIGTEPRDCVWPHNIYLSFMIFVKEVTTGFVDNPAPLREISISPFSLPQPYAGWLNGLWAKPVEQWSFQWLHDTLVAAPEQDDQPVQATSASLWMSSVEGALQAIKKHVHHVETQEVSGRLSIQDQLKALDEKGDRLSQAYERHLGELERSRAQLAEQLQQQHQAKRDIAEQLEKNEQAKRALEEQLRGVQSASEHWQQSALQHEQIALQHEQRAAQHEALVAHHQALVAELEARVANSEQRVRDLLASKSWFVTKPMRVVVVQGNRLSRGLLNKARSSLRKSATVLIRQMASRPALKRRLVSLLNYHPPLAAHLRQFARNQGLAAGSKPVGEAGLPGMLRAEATGPVDEALSARGHEVMHKFEKAIKTKDVR
ncbi:methyltransferase domain-containing protein [Pseudomonas sp. TWI672]|uniref:methyltransferase domain-containing protein n=1 Tax=unclassified Pseudomonas TaxID=196821 RepID=UPI00320A53B1